MRAVLAILFASLTALAAAETPRDFAYGVSLETRGGEGLFEVALPATVHEGAVRADLADLRVFNAGGEPVPFAFLPPPEATRERRQSLRLPYFALRGEAATGVDGVVVRLEQVGSKALLTMNAGGKTRHQDRLLGYIVDASSVREPVQALAVELAPTVNHLVTRLRVDTSDDLAQWSTLVADAPLVRLRAGEERLEQLRVEFPARKSRYFRVSWPVAQPLSVTGLTLEPAEGVIEESRLWKAVTARAMAAKERTTSEYVADLGGQFPVDRLRLRLPQQNTVASIAIQSRAKASDPWRLAAGTTAYRFLVDGQEIVSQDLVLKPTSDRYWQLRVDLRGGGLGGGDVELVAGWLPQRIVFAARSPAPFMLAYGSRGAQAAAFPITTVVPGYRADGVNGRDSRVLGRAGIGAPVVLAGEQAVREAVDWRRLSLWGSLVLAVALLAWMALRLARQVSRSSPPTTTERPSES